jgi:adenine-specific DNA-methyltransferase
VSTIEIAPKFDLAARCVLFEGNCLDLLPQIPDGLIKLVITSPPYNLGKPYEQRLDLHEYLDQQREVIEQCVRVTGEAGSICWQVGNYVYDSEIIPLDIILYPIFAEYGLHLRNRVVWYFEHGLHASKRFSGRYEVILWFTKGGNYTFNLDAVRIPQKYPGKKYFKGPKRGQLSGNPLGKNPGDVWQIPNVKANHVEKTIHPCQFPVELVERLVLSMTNEGDWVLDPFMGVGSTAIASLIHGRRTVGAEAMSEYMTIAKERINLAAQGQLKIRPMERPVYDPSAPSASIPPKTVHLGSEVPSQLGLLDPEANYLTEDKNEDCL